MRIPNISDFYLHKISQLKKEKKLDAYIQNLNSPSIINTLTWNMVDIDCICTYIY